MLVIGSSALARKAEIGLGREVQRSSFAGATGAAGVTMTAMFNWPVDNIPHLPVTTMRRLHMPSFTATWLAQL